jgi:hypothetical protein
MHSPVFILSTGRTGTTFFEDYFNHTSDALCRHEPWPSRRFKFLSNLYLNQKVSARYVGRVYRNSRRRIFRSLHGRPYIESSNFIFGCMNPIGQLFGELKIVHLVRHPVDYVSSHLGKGFWKGHKRFFARHVPYWLEKLDLEDRSDPIEILAARWNYVNRRIDSYADSHPCLRVRFEELFSEDPLLADRTLNQVREFCGLAPLDPSENARWLSDPKNVSPQKPLLGPGEEERIRDLCGELMHEYNYR